MHLRARAYAVSVGSTHEALALKVPLFHMISEIQERNHGIDIGGGGGGSKCEPSPRYFFLSSVADQIVKTNSPGHQRMNRGLSMEWEARELLGL